MFQGSSMECSEEGSMECSEEGSMECSKEGSMECSDRRFDGRALEFDHLRTLDQHSVRRKVHTPSQCRGAHEQPQHC